MPHITLYLPNNPMPEEYDVKSYRFHDGQLHFTVGEGAGAFSIATTVPFLIRQPVEEKSSSSVKKNTASTGSTTQHTAWT
jgi:hypothetical protein